MAPRDAAKLVLIGMAILSLMYAVGQIGRISFIGMSCGSEDLLARVTNLVGSVLPPLLLLWLAVHLILHRDRYSERLFPEPSTGQPEGAAHHAYTIGLTLIGVYLIVQATPDIIQFAAWAGIKVLQAYSSPSIASKPPGSSLSSPLMTRLLVIGFVANLWSVVLGALLVKVSPRLGSWLLSRPTRAATPDTADTEA